MSSPASRPRLPFAHLNLRRNPFGEVAREERPALVVADLEPLLAEIADPGRAVQIIGDSGRGKTSLLLALGARLPDACYVRVDPGSKRGDRA